MTSEPIFCPNARAVNPLPVPAPANARPKDNGNFKVFPAKKSVIAAAIVFPGAVLPVDTGAQASLTDV